MVKDRKYLEAFFDSEEFYEIINSGDGGDGEDLVWEILTD